MAAVGLLGAIVTGVPAAGFNLRAGVAAAVQAQARGRTVGRTTQRQRHGFIVNQVALAFVLLACAGLLGLSLQQAMAVAIAGWVARHVVPPLDENHAPSAGARGSDRICSPGGVATRPPADPIGGRFRSGFRGQIGRGYRRELPPESGIAAGPAGAVHLQPSGARASLPDGGLKLDLAGPVGIGCPHPVEAPGVGPSVIISEGRGPPPGARGQVRDFDRDEGCVGAVGRRRHATPSGLRARAIGRRNRGHRLGLEAGVGCDRGGRKFEVLLVPHNLHQRGFQPGCIRDLIDDENDAAVGPPRARQMTSSRFKPLCLNDRCSFVFEASPAPLQGASAPG